MIKDRGCIIDKGKFRASLAIVADGATHSWFEKIHAFCVIVNGELSAITLPPIVRSIRTQPNTLLVTVKKRQCYYGNKKQAGINPFSAHGCEIKFQTQLSN